MGNAAANVDFKESAVEVKRAIERREFRIRFAGEPAAPECLACFLAHIISLIGTVDA